MSKSKAVTIFGLLAVRDTVFQSFSVFSLTSSYSSFARAHNTPCSHPHPPPGKNIAQPLFLNSPDISVVPRVNEHMVKQNFGLQTRDTMKDVQMENMRFASLKKHK